MLTFLVRRTIGAILVLFALIVANNILFETGLSFLGAGVRDPDPSWGNIIAQGQQRLSTAPTLALVPGIAIVLTVLALNVFGDGLRDALDPRAAVLVSATRRRRRLLPRPRPRRVR